MSWPQCNKAVGEDCKQCPREGNNVHYLNNVRFEFDYFIYLCDEHSRDLDDAENN